MIRHILYSRILALIMILLAATVGWGFEIETHADISRAAFERSRVPEFLQSIGIDPVRPLRCGLFCGSQPPVEWLRTGARNEDDTFSLNPARYRNHFFDPVNNTGLNARGVRGQPAPDWALEDRGQFFTQDFSYRDARASFLTALIDPSPTHREWSLAKTFESLGHVLHLIHDMASPPHTRNDIHGGGPLGQSSLFEKYLEPLLVRARLNFNGTPVRLGMPRDYWTTGDGRGLAEFTNRNFVSEGTNFARAEEGARGGDYPNPVLRFGTDEQGRPFMRVMDIQEELERGLRDRRGNLIQGKVLFFANNFQDPITRQPLRNERMTTFSLFDRELLQKGQKPLFTLNRYNIEAQAAFLIPRAVGYSAGLLDYFFRGRLTVERVGPSETAGAVRVVVKNLMSDERMKGMVTLYYDDPSDDLRKPVAGGGYPFSLWPISFDIDLGPGETSAEFALQTSNVAEAARTAGRYLAVFAGQLGNERDAVAATRVQIAAPRVGILCHGCVPMWQVSAPGATLTIEATGTGNSGTIQAQALNSNGECLATGCDVTYPFSIDSPTTPVSLSFTAASPPGAAISQFNMEVGVTGPGGFVCITKLTSQPDTGVIWLYFSGQRTNCPE